MDLIKTGYNICGGVLSAPAKILNPIFAQPNDKAVRLIMSCGAMGLAGYLSTKVVRYFGPICASMFSADTILKYGLQSFEPTTAVYLTVLQPIAYKFAEVLIPRNNNMSLAARYAVSVLIPAVVLASTGVPITLGALFLLQAGSLLLVLVAKHIPGYQHARGARNIELLVDRDNDLADADNLRSAQASV
jgi:hypothetical protein